MTFKFSLNAPDMMRQTQQINYHGD